MQLYISNDSSLELLCKAHLDEIALSLRRLDHAELWAMYHLPVRAGLELCAKRSSLAVAFKYRGEVACVAGVAPQSLLGQSACLWSWTGSSADKCPKLFWKASKKMLEIFLLRYPCLYAVCDERYEAARRYLLHLGALERGESFYLQSGETRFRLYVFISKPEEYSTDKEKLWEEHY